jgi:hypothetical protein
MNAWKWVGLAVLALASAAIFAAYRQPDMMVSLTNAFLAMCGFR